MRPVIAVLLMLFAVSASASGLSYSYVEGSYDHGFGDNDFNGLHFRGSYDGIGGWFNDRIFGFGEAGFLKTTGKSGIKGYDLVLGSGMHYPIAASTDVFGTVAALYGKRSHAGSDLNWRVGGGVRVLLTSELEAQGTLSFGGYKDAGMSVGAKAIYNFTDKVGLTLGVETSHDDPVLSVGLRMSF